MRTTRTVRKPRARVVENTPQIFEQEVETDVFIASLGEERENKKFPIKSVVVVFVCVAVLVAYAVFRSKEVAPDAVSQQTAAETIAEVSKFLLLPSDESPTIAVVADVEKLRGQEFFRNAEIGDKLLVYAKAGKAILYSPTREKIIEVAPINSSLGNVTRP